MFIRLAHCCRHSCGLLPYICWRFRWDVVWRRFIKFSHSLTVTTYSFRSGKMCSNCTSWTLTHSWTDRAERTAFAPAHTRPQYAACSDSHGELTVYNIHKLKCLEPKDLYSQHSFKVDNRLDFRQEQPLVLINHHMCLFYKHDTQTTAYQCGIWSVTCL